MILNFITLIVFIFFASISWKILETYYYDEYILNEYILNEYIFEDLESGLC